MGGWKVGGRICLMPFLCFLVATLLVVSSSTFYYTTKTTDTMMMSRRTRPPSPSSLQEALSHDEKGAAPRRRRASETTPKVRSTWPKKMVEKCISKKWENAPTQEVDGTTTTAHTHTHSPVATRREKIVVAHPPARTATLDLFGERSYVLQRLTDVA